MNDIALPTSYRPYPELIFCSNHLRHVRIPIAIESRPLVLVGIGDDETSSIWLSYAKSKRVPRKWEWLVENNQRKDDAVEIVLAGPSMGIYFNKSKLLHVTTISPQQSASVIDLDLRPLGIAIHGDMQGLTIGGVKQSHNFFQGGTMVQIGSPQI